MSNQTRRTFLKSAAYTSTLSVFGLSSLVFAKPKPLTLPNNDDYSALPTCDITLFNKQTNAKQKVEFINHTDKAITIDSISPVGLEHVNDALIVKFNKLQDEAITLNPGEYLAFEIKVISKNPMNEAPYIPNVLAGHLKVVSDHHAFNGIIPVIVFDSQVA